MNNQTPPGAATSSPADIESSTTMSSSTTNNNCTAPKSPPKFVPLAGRKTNPCDLLKNLKQADKKSVKKPTILEQTQKDWIKRKAEENIEDELKQATKSKTGYLDRQLFLQQTDLRQFERERQIRDKIRSNRPPQ